MQARNDASLKHIQKNEKTLNSKFRKLNSNFV
jgi:hypothetical protein